MTKSNIVFQLSGSIACYKSCEIISSLIKDGHSIKCVMTKSSLKFIGLATLEGLTGNKVIHDTFEEGSMMSHIELVNWADLFILSPATANTINKLASGIADNILGALFLANNFKKPYLIAPAMNTQMLEHPATKSSLQKLKSWGVNVLNAEEGILACGEIGPGRLLNPLMIKSEIQNSLNIEGVQ